VRLEKTYRTGKAAEPEREEKGKKITGIEPELN
jgi:hypothetical protein